jgi:hypothetical protein
MTSTFNQNLFDTLSLQLNKCIRQDIEDKYSEESAADTLIDFKPCCTQKEERILKKAIVKALYVKPRINPTYVYLAVIYYYYYTIVLEYYFTYMCPIKMLFKKLNMPKDHVKTVERLIMDITTSNDEWASYIRRKLNNWNEDSTSAFVGGKRRKTSKRKLTKKKNAKKNKTRRNRL